MRIAVTAPYFVPAIRAGGPIPGIQGVLDTLSGQELRVFTGDRDLGDEQPFPRPYRGTTEVGGIPVTYLPSRLRGSVGAWRSALRALRNSDIVYVNSLFSAPFTVWPLLALKLGRYCGTVVISPRGELADTALQLGKRPAKGAWLTLIRALRMHRSIGRSGNVVWLASSAREAEDINRHYRSPQVAVCPERLRAWDGPVQQPRPPQPGPLKVICIGRIAPIKGVLELVRAAQRVTRPLQLTLVGLEEEADYVARVKKAAAGCPDWVQVELVGPVGPAQLRELMLDHDLFALLTRGENFGHAIGEALQMGLPVLITDQTPWSHVGPRGAGRVLSAQDADQPALVAGILDEFADLDLPGRTRMHRAALECAGEAITAPGQLTLLEAVAQFADRG